MPSPGLLQEVAQHRVAVLGEDALGVELHALDRQLLVAHAHDLAVLGPGSDLQHLGAARALDGQRVVAVHRELRGQPSEHALLRGGDDAGLAVHELLRANDLAAKGRTNALVPQTHAQDGQLAGKVLDGSHRDTGFQRRARAGRDHHAIRCARSDALDGDLVVAEHLHIRAQLAEVLDDVVGEAVVVVDHQELHGWLPCEGARRRANSRCSKAM
jgi:hypothetical protein